LRDRRSLNIRSEFSAERPRPPKSCLVCTFNRETDIMKTIAYVLATLATIAFVAPAGAKTVIVKHDRGYHHHHGGEKIVIKKGHHND
jgi:hypothetical protein